MRKMIAACLGVLLCLTAIAQSTQESLPPKVYLVGNAHFDSQWRWTVQQSIEEFLPNTMMQNFMLFEEYPEYVFNFEGACKYAWMKEYYPMLFEKVKYYVDKDRWHLSGSSWDANDTNVPSVESTFRNVLLGQEFFKREFGRKSTDIMLPDCFGFSWTLPSVAAHCGIIGFSTQKLSWRHQPFYEGGRKYPFEFGLWQGVDGSRLMAAMDGGGYGWNPREDLVDNAELKAKISDSAVNAAYRYFGTRSSELRGDRGGSPLPRTVRHIARSMKRDSLYEIRMVASDAIYKDFAERQELLPVFDGELLMDVHATGCYTSNAWMKALNRRNEQLACAAEAGGVMADWMGVMDYPHYALNDAWSRVLWHQFHDDLPGTSIPAAYTFSYNDEIIAQNQFAGVIESSIEAVASSLDTRVKCIPVVVYNPVAVRNTDLVSATVSLPVGYNDVAVYGPDGRRVKSQIVGRDGSDIELAFASDVPPVSLSVYDIRPMRSVSGRKSGNLRISGNTVENSIYKVTLNENGDIASIIDKRCGREMVGPGKAFALNVFEENTSDRWPSWEILKKTVDKTPVCVKDDVRITAEQFGELMAVLRIERKYGNSVFVQKIRLTDGAVDDRIDIHNSIDWKSERTLLKAGFPMSFASPTAVYDLGLGHISRGNNTPAAYEVCAYHWADMSAGDGSYGVCIMNDGKYGWDKPDDNTLRMTLIHTPTADEGWFPHEKDQDICRHEFTYSVCGHIGSLKASDVSAKAWMLNSRKMAFATSCHKGFMGKSFSMIESSSDNLVIKCLKKAEDGDGYIVRLYETDGKDGSAGTVCFPSEILSAEIVNGIEEYMAPAEFDKSVLTVKADHFEPVTYRVRLKGRVTGNPVRYEPLRLPYSTMGITSDAFCSVGQMDASWHSYAAEMIPDTLEYRGIPFVFGEADYANVVKCSGQKISVPAGSDGVCLLVAAAEKDDRAVFKAGESEYGYDVPYWSGFFGQCEWRGHIKAFRKDADIAYVGTHRHSSKKRNEPYLFTYMYMLYVPMNGGTELRFPENRNITVMAATAVQERYPGTTAVSEIVTKIK